MTLEALIPYAPYILIPLLVSLIDFITMVRARFNRIFHLNHEVTPSQDYTILVPIFGSISYLKNIEFLKKYADHVVLCTTSKETAVFNRDIERISNEYGFRIFRSDVQRATKTKTNPWNLFRRTLHGSVEEQILSEEARDEIIRDSFAVVRTKYCIFVDGDTVADGDLDKLIGMMEEKDYDITSVRVLVSQTKTLMEKLQSVEYELAMDARKVYPWLTSGAAMVAKTEVIKDIMFHHSLFFSGGDIEIGKLASMLRYKIGHLPFVFLTDVPATFMTWFRQRMAWFGGGFRHAVINIHRFTWRHPIFFIYTTIFVYLLAPLRWYEVIVNPEVLPIVICIYWFLIFTFHWRKARWYYILFPFYALIQILILVPLGVLTYFKMVYSSKNAGLIKLRHGRAIS